MGVERAEAEQAVDFLALSASLYPQSLHFSSQQPL